MMRHLFLRHDLLGLSFVLAVLASALATAPPALAQEPADPALDGEIDASFSGVVEVDVVDVDVVVTDGDGNFVGGLDRDDFEVFEDGRPVRVTHFRAISGAPREAVVTTAPPVEPTVDAEPASAAPVPATEPVVAPRDPLWVVVYIDNLFLSPFDRNKVLRAVRSFLRTHVQPGDRVMVASFDRSLHVRQPFTADLQAVQDALLEQEELTAYGVAAETGRFDALKRMNVTRRPSEALTEADYRAKEIAHDVETSLRGLGEMVGSLGGLPGRKVLVHVSNGLPLVPGEDLFTFYDLRYPDSGFSGRMIASRYDKRRAFRELTARANSNRVTFYTIEGAGLRSHGSLSAEYGALSSGGISQGSLIDVDVARMVNEQESLQIMAVETGGLATLGTNNIDGGLERIADDMRAYYSLGYMSSQSSDGRYHEIEVRVKDPRAKVIRHRAGYRSKAVSTRVEEGTLAALLHQAGENPLDIELRLGQPQPTEERGQWLVPVEVRVPLSGATLLPRGATHEGRLRVSLAALDENGSTSGVRQDQIPLTIRDEDLARARQQSWVYEAQLLMRDGDHRVAAGVRDELGGESSFVHRSLTVGR